MNNKSTKSSKTLTPTRLSGDSTNSSPVGTSKLKKLTSGKTAGIPTPKSKALKKKPVQKAIAENQVLAVLKNGLTIKICCGMCSPRKCEGKCAEKVAKKTAKAKGKTGTPSPRKALKTDANNNVKTSKGAIPKQPKATKGASKVNFEEVEAEFLTFKGKEAVKELQANKLVKEEKATPKKAAPTKKIPEAKFEEKNVSVSSDSTDEPCDQLVNSQEEVPCDSIADQPVDSQEEVLPKNVRRGGDDTDVSNSESFETEEEHEIDEEIEREGLEELAAIQDKLLDNSKDKPKKDKIKLPDTKDEKKLDKSLKKDVKMAKAKGKLSKYVDKFLNEEEYDGDESDSSSESETLTSPYCSCSDFEEVSSDSYDCFHESSSEEKDERVVPRLKLVRQQSFRVVNF